MVHPRGATRVLEQLGKADAFVDIAAERDGTIVFGFAARKAALVGALELHASTGERRARIGRAVGVALAAFCANSDASGRGLDDDLD